MKPRTANEKEVTRLAKRLRPLTEAQERWIDRYAVPAKAFIYQKSTGLAWCSNCGDSFLDEPKVKRCPHCGAPITVHEYKPQRKVSNGRWYTTIVTTCEGWQVSRHFLVDHYCRKGSCHGNPAFEAVQIWTNVKGEQVIMARSIRPMMGYYDAWNFHSEITVKHRRDCYDYKYNISSHANKVCRVLPILKRNGFKGSFHGISPDDLWKYLLRSNEAEMLFKTRQFSMLRRMIRRGDYTLPYRYAINICNRNRYIIKDADMWTDYMKLLCEFGMDVHNAHYVCPKDLKAAHDTMMVRKQRKDAREKRERLKKELKRAEEVYGKFIKQYLGVVIIGEGFTIKPIKTVVDVVAEGEAMHHCVFTNGYYKKKNTLLMSATDNKGKRIETIEFNLKTGKVMQSRGVCNQITDKHDKIIALVEKYKNMIINGNHQQRRRKADNQGVERLCRHTA